MSPGMLADVTATGPGAESRRAALQALDGPPFDLIVVGGGINGTGIARDAAMRGLRVLLIEKDDLGAGSTAYSTRLIHGGLRYLEFFELGLVRESLREREILLRIAPHLVRPLPLLIPFYRSGRYPAALVRMGLVAYDALSFDKSLPNHRFLTRADALRRVPGMNPEGLRGAGLYFDAQADYPERLCVENVLSASAHGAAVLTRARAERLLVKDERVLGVEVRDLPSGRAFTVLGRLTVNATGAWVDELSGTLATPPGRMLGGTKGSHVVVDPFPGAPRDSLYFEAGADGRPMFIVPWQDRYYLIGSTDIRYEGDLDRVVAEPAEIRYFLEEANRIIVGAGLTPASVRYSYSGVRPLPYTSGTREGRITRRHILHDHAPLTGLLTVVGGKLTTYRSLAEEAVDHALRVLGRPRRRSPTGLVPLPGAAGEPGRVAEWLARERGLQVEVAERLAGLYGTRAAEVLRAAGDDPDLLRPLGGEAPTVGAELVLAFRAELAGSLADAFLRRTMTGLAGDRGLGALDAALEVGRRHLGWDAERSGSEAEEYQRALERYAPAGLPVGAGS